MSRIESFKRALAEKRAVKIIAGIDNFDAESVKKVVVAASNSGASAVDICAREDIIREVRSMTDMPIFVSSVVPSELARAVELGADGLEVGNFDTLYKEGRSFSAQEVLDIVKETKSLIGDSDIFFCVTVPGEISTAEQIELAHHLEEMGIDLIQTEGHYHANSEMTGARALMDRAELTISNTIELCRNVEIPVMTATGINPTTAPFAFAAGASAIGCGSCINKLSSEIAMIATSTALVEIAKRNSVKIPELV
jgi:putative N-acetylmannosamine-6-phosphate epimerase